MTQTSDDLPGFERRLLSELLQVVSDRQHVSAGLAGRARADRPTPVRVRRRFLVPAGALAVLAAAIVGPSIVAPGGSSASAYALETLPSGRIHVVLAPDFDQAERLRAELDDAGVDVRPVTITAAPALVGAIEILPLAGGSHSAAAPPPDGLEVTDGEFWIDPERYDGSVELIAYVAPPPGEAWQQAVSVFHPDQPLGGLPCSLEGPLTSAALEAAARGVGIERFTWLAQTGDPTGDQIQLIDSAERPDGEVAEASLRAPGELQAIVRPTALVERFGRVQQLSMSLNLHDADEPACTPELAARW